MHTWRDSGPSITSLQLRFEDGTTITARPRGMTLLDRFDVCIRSAVFPANRIGSCGCRAHLRSSAGGGAPERTDNEKDVDLRNAAGRITCSPGRWSIFIRFRHRNALARAEEGQHL